jgi:hypothetical protein
LEAGGRSNATGVAIVVAASVFGLLLPLAFGSSDSPALALIWLVLALAACMCLLLPLRQIARSAANLLRRGAPARADWSLWNDRTAADIARLLVAAGYVVLLQAILRHPLVAIFGANADPFLVEAAVGGLGLLAVLGLLSWMYTVARPLLERMARATLDAALVTAPSAEAAAMASGATEAVPSAATILSPRARASQDSESTVLSPRPATPEGLATELAPDATPTVRVDQSAEDATEISG